MHKNTTVNRTRQEYKKSILVIFFVVLIGLGLNYFYGEIDLKEINVTIKNSVFFICILFLLISVFFRKTNFFSRFTSIPFSVVLLFVFLIFCFFIGIIPQAEYEVIENIRRKEILNFHHILFSWPFILVFFLLILSLGALIIRRLIRFKVKDFGFYCNHLGVWFILVALAFSAIEDRSYLMTINIGETEWRVLENTNDIIELPIAVELYNCHIKYYEEKEMPISTKLQNRVETVYARIKAVTVYGTDKEATIEFNKPLTIDNWHIFLHSYDLDSDINPEYCNILLVYNKWYWLLYFGVSLTIIGALYYLINLRLRVEKNVE